MEGLELGLTRWSKGGRSSWQANFTEFSEQAASIALSSPHTERHTAVDSLWNSGKIAKANDPKAKLTCLVAIRKHLGEDFELRALKRDA
jgi:hypothetical protein